MVRRNRYLLLGLMIVLILSGVPNGDCIEIKEVVEVHSLDVGGIDPPTIGWMFSENATVATGAHYDSIYQGQTEWTWPYSSWINDSDSIDTVFFQYRHSTSDEWMNRTPLLESGDSIRGEYSYTFVQEIWWDWEANQPQMDGGGFYTAFRIFANDSLGNWRVTLATFRDGGWMGIDYPWQYWFRNAITYILAIGTIIVLFIATMIRRRSR